MKRLLATTAIITGALYCGVPTTAQAAETATFCGPASGMACETQNDLMVFLQDAKNVTQGFGNIGSQNGTPVITITSDGGALQKFLDLSNGFATIKPTQGASTFNGIDITVPGFTFTQLVFDEQLTPVAGQSSDPFTITGYTGAHVQVSPVGNETDAADTDKEFSITAVGGTFDEVNILAAGGFDEIKHLEIAGLAPIPTSAPEPTAIALLGVGLLGLGLVRRRR
jgi:hypothetical protein